MCFVRSFNPTTLSSKGVKWFGQLVGEHPQAPYVFANAKNEWRNASHS